MSSVRIYVDLDDVYDEMDRRDKSNMAQWLYEDGIFESHTNPEIRKMVRGDLESFGEKELRDNLSKLWRLYYQMSEEDIDKINEIGKKY
jgi:hypothetical protein